MTGASGVRSWLQNHHLTWLTPRRLRVATIAVFVMAILVSSVGLSGSTKAPSASARMAATAATR
ncbi:MAG: hypothetical protein ACR2HD_08600 [Solirubrobacteraceae bacterium]